MNGHTDGKEGKSYDHSAQAIFFHSHRFSIYYINDAGLHLAEVPGQIALRYQAP